MCKLLSDPMTPTLNLSGGSSPPQPYKNWEVCCSSYCPVLNCLPYPDHLSSQTFLSTIFTFPVMFISTTSICQTFIHSFHFPFDSFGSHHEYMLYLLNLILHVLQVSIGFLGIPNAWYFNLVQ